MQILTQSYTCIHLHCTPMIRGCQGNTWKNTNHNSFSEVPKVYGSCDIATMLELSLVSNSILLGFLGLSSLLYVLWSWYRPRVEQRKPIDGLPMPPNSHWFWGHIRSLAGNDFRRSLQYLSEDYCNKYGQTCFWSLSRPAVVVTHWEDVRTILHHSHSRVPISIARHHVNQFLGSRNIGLLNGKEWKFHRTSILRALRPKFIQESKVGIHKVMKTLLQSLKQNEKPLPIEIDIGSLMKMITLDIFGQTALNMDIGCCLRLKPSPLAVAFDYMGEEMTRRMFHTRSPADYFYWIPTPSNRRYQRERKLLRQFLQTTIQDRRCQAFENSSTDLLDSVLKGLASEQEFNPKMNSDLADKTLSDILLSLLFAGYDTTSITLTYALYHIATNPEIEKNCLQEILRTEDWDPDTLPFCQAVLLETLRLYPPGPITTRTIESPLKLRGGAVIPENTLAWIPIWNIHRKDENFERPLEFRPDRWVLYQQESQIWIERSEDESSINDDADRQISPVNRNAFVAFSAGARSCPGSQFAKTEAVLILAYLVKHLTFTLPSDYELYPIRAGLVQRPRDAMNMTVRWRE
jgi:cytochrome P450